MKARHSLLFLSLGLAVLSGAPPAEPVTESKSLLAGSAVRGRIMELLRQDVRKIPAAPKETIAPNSVSDSAADDQSVSDDVLELEPFIVTQKKPVELSPRVPKLTLDNFFYGDGKIAESAGKRISLSAGPEKNGLAALKFNLKF